MRYFQLLATGMPTLPIMHAIARNPSWWDMDTARTSFEGSPHAQAHDIILRACATEGRSLAEAYVDLDAEDREVMRLLPMAKSMVLDLMRLVGGSRLGRVVIARTEPGGKIGRHKDEGAYADYYTRYHVVLQGLPGSIFICGDEDVNMKTGDWWWFDHKEEHMLINNSQDDRVHMIVDVRIDQ